MAWLYNCKATLHLTLDCNKQVNVETFNDHTCNKNIQDTGAIKDCVPIPEQGVIDLKDDM